MSKLHEILAVEPSARKRSLAAEATLQSRVRAEGRTAGGTRTYARLDDEGPQYPSESSLVQVRVADELDRLAEVMSSMFDVVATKDHANCDARADVLVEGMDEPILTDVPVSHLLFLENQLSGLREVVLGLPTLHPGRRWEWDSDANAWVTGPQEVFKMKKLPRAFEESPATQQHPAKTHLYWEDQPIGTWTEYAFSGAMQADRVRKIGDRINLLISAIKQARERANSIEAPQVSEGQTIFGYLLAD